MLTGGRIDEIGSRLKHMPNKSLTQLLVAQQAQVPNASCMEKGSNIISTVL
jgi:hypothetical protein